MSGWRRRVVSIAIQGVLAACVATMLVPPRVAFAAAGERREIPIAFVPGSALSRVLAEVAARNGADLPDPAALDVVDPKNGNLFLSETDLAFAGSRDTRIELTRVYNSRARVDGAFGHGWVVRWDERITPDGHGGLELIDADGATLDFRRDGLDPKKGRARLAAELTEEISRDHAAHGRYQSQAYYEGFRQKLATDDAFFRDNLHRVPGHAPSPATTYWSVQRGAQRIERARDGYRRITRTGAIERFDRDGRLVSVVDREGRTVTLNRDAKGRLTALHDDDGRSLAFRYDRANRVVEVRDSLDRSIAYSYDAAGHLVRAVGPAVATRYEWGAGNNLVARRDAAGDVMAVVYDDRDRVAEVRGPAARDARFEYEISRAAPLALATRIVEKNGATRSIAYDDGARSITLVDELGARRTTFFGERGEILRSIDPTGGVTELRYDEAGHRVAMRDPSGRVTRYRWNAAGDLVGRLTPDGREVKLARDAHGNVVRATDGMRTWAWKRDAEGNVVEAIAPDGTVTRVKRDARGDADAVQYADGRVVRRAFDPAGNLAADGRTRLHWDAADRLDAIDGPEGSVRIARDAAGRPVAASDMAGGVLGFHWTTDGRLAEARGLDGERAAWRYEDRTTTVTAPGGTTWKIARDAAGRMIAAADPMGHTMRWERDAAGRVTTRILANGAKESYRYDAAGRLVETTAVDGGVTKFRYDAAGRLAAITNPLGATFGFEWTKDGRIARMIDGAGKARSFAYDARGFRSASVDERGVQTTWHFDDEGRLLAAADPTHAWRFDRDDEGRIVGITARQAGGGAPRTASIVRDAAGRVVGIGDGLGHRAKIERDATGLATSRTTSTGEIHRFTHDKAGRLVEIADTHGVTKIAWDAAGNPVRETLPDGRVITRAFDADGRLVEARVPGATPGRPDVWRYEWDARGDTTAFIAPDGTRTEVAYDAAGRVVHAASATYTYDLAGQIRTATLADGTTARFEYDAAGHRTAILRTDARAARHATEHARLAPSREDRLASLFGDFADRGVPATERSNGVLVASLGLFVPGVASTTVNGNRHSPVDGAAVGSGNDNGTMCPNGGMQPGSQNPSSTGNDTLDAILKAILQALSQAAGGGGSGAGGGGSNGGGGSSGGGGSHGGGSGGGSSGGGGSHGGGGSGGGSGSGSGASGSPNGTNQGGGSNMNTPLAGGDNSSSADQTPDPSSTVDSGATDPSMNVPGVGDVTANPDGSTTVDPQTGTPLDGTNDPNAVSPSGTDNADDLTPPGPDATQDEWDAWIDKLVNKILDEMIDDLLAGLLGDDTPNTAQSGDADPAKPADDEKPGNDRAGVKR